MKKILILVILSLIFSMLVARDFKFEDVRKVMVLKDGSVLFGKIEADKSKKDSICFSTKYIKHAMIEKKGVKFYGSNLNSGIMFGIIPFYNFDTGDGKYFTPAPFISSMSTFNANVSSGLDLTYFYRSFKKSSEKYVYPKDNESNGALISGEYKYKGSFLIPTYTFRINVLPDDIKYKLDVKNIYPYLGLGVGYNFSMVKYHLADRDSVLIDTTTYDSRDMSEKNHFFIGLNYKFSIGVSYKIIDRIAVVLEGAYYNSTYKQTITDTEDKVKMEREKFTSSGFTLVLGFRFGKF